MRKTLTDPDIGWAIALTSAAAIALLMLTSCASTREEAKKEVQTEQTTTKTSPLVADSPFGQVTIQPATVTVERRQVTDTNAHASFEVQPSIPPSASAAGGSLLGLIPGVGGLLAAGWALLGKRQSDGALKAIVDGVEAFKGEADSKQVDHLHACLSRRMDASHKALIRKAKP